MLFRSLVALALAVWLVPVDRLVAAPPPPLPGVPRSGAVVSVVPPAAPADLTATGWTPTGTIPFNDIPGALELPVELPGPVEPVFGR